MPSAIVAALVPETPPPMISTSAAGAPGTPPRRTPRPAQLFFQRMGADLRREAPSDFRHRREESNSPDEAVTVSYAIQTEPLETKSCVCTKSGARCR